MSQTGLSHPRPLGSSLDQLDPYSSLDWMHFRASGDGQIPAGRIFPYTIESLNLPGPPPRPHGPPAWGEDPYGYTENHKDASRLLGWSDWTKHPQCVTFPHKYLTHRAFIPLNPRSLAVNDTRPWPFERVYFPEYQGNDVYRIKAPFFHRVRNQGDSIRGMVNCYHLAFHRLALKPASEFNYEWSVGNEWLDYMQKANNMMLWWQTLDWVEEVRRRLLDALGWMEMAMRQLIHHLAVVANFNPPQFVTEGCFVGAMVDSYYLDARDLAIEIAKLGAPVWMVSFAERSPPLTLVPPGAAEKHPILQRILQTEKKSNPSAHADSMAVRQQLSFWLQELIDRGQATRPLAWFEPARHPPSEKAGKFFVDPDLTPSPAIRDMRDPFLLHVLKQLDISAWLQSEKAPDRFQQDLDSLIKIFGCAVFNPGSVTSPPYLPSIFTENQKSLQALHSVVYPGIEPADWRVISHHQEYKPLPLEPGAHKLIVQLDIL